MNPADNLLSQNSGMLKKEKDINVK